MKKQAGFTLIELVMVIVILGILAAVALPKFVNLGSDARVAAMKGVEGAMRSANAMIYAKAAVASKLGATGSVTILGNDIGVKWGFATDLANLRAVMDLSSDYTTSGNTLTHSGAQDLAHCIIIYYPAGAADSAPTYPADVTGC